MAGVEASRTTAEIRNDVIVATEHIKAPPEVVFPYFTDPAVMTGADQAGSTESHVTTHESATLTDHNRWCSLRFTQRY